MFVRDEYDERQLLARGQAFRVGFFTSLVVSFLLCFIAGFCFVPLRPGSFCLLSFLVWPPITAFSICAIRNGAFEGSLKQRNWLNQREFLSWGIAMTITFGYLIIAKGGPLDETLWLRSEIGGLVGGLCCTTIGVAALAYEKRLQEQGAVEARHMNSMSAKGQNNKRLVGDLLVGVLTATICTIVAMLFG